jgi:hypothetical protein
MTDHVHTTRTIRIGAGAGFSGDRIEPAVEVAEKGDVQYLVFECLAERTIAIAQAAKRKDPSQGYDPLLAARMRAVLPTCRARGIRVITNMGAANPLAAAERTVAIARDLGIAGLKVAAVTGDDVTDALRGSNEAEDETGAPVAGLGERLISANAYLGAGPIVEALERRADVVITGRTADPAMFLAPQIHEFGWSMEDWERLGRGTVVGHLLECAGQITGGYFADPGFKDVPDLARLGFPIAEVAEDGTAIITKVAGSGGRVTAATCKEQLLYEVHDPARYLQPDVIADFSGVSVTEIGPDRVRIEGGGGRPRTGTLKVSVGYLDSCIGEGQISYAGPGAVARGRLALAIVAERLRLIGAAVRELRCELIGVDAILGPELSAGAPEPREVRARVAGRTDSLEEAQRIADEVDALYLNGPASGGGVFKAAREIVGIRSTLVPEGLATPVIHLLES